MGDSAIREEVGSVFWAPFICLTAHPFALWFSLPRIIGDMMLPRRKENGSLRTPRLDWRNMNCWHCNSKVIWGADFSYEDYGMDGEGIVSTFSCSNCNATYECYLDLGDTSE